jgi:hypothetical protein
MVAWKVLRPERCAVLDGNPCSACTEDMKLEKKIKELEVKIEKINIRRRALRTAMNENHDPLIHKFPPEIASQIFIQYPPLDNPLYLGAVCQKWRQLAWATPELWTSLDITPYNSIDHPSLVNEWLERSASLPLTIRFEDHRRWVDDDDKMISILNKHSARWLDLELNLLARHLYRFSGSSQGNILSRLVLCPPLPRPGTPSDFSTFSMKSKPSPTMLELSAVGLSHVNIAWSNLIKVWVVCIGVDDCFELVRRAPLLEILKLHEIRPSSSVFPIPNTRIVHRHLRRLELSKIGERVLVRLLDLLCLPSLEQWIHDFTPFPLENMIAFIGCLSSCLQIFKINADKIDYHQVTRLLSHLSSLKVLELRAVDRPPTDEFFGLLCASAQSPQYLPHLQSLEFLCKFDFPWKSLPQIFALPRWQSLKVRVKPLALLAIDDKDMDLLLELTDKGFDFRVIRDGKDWLQEYMKRQQTQHL